MMRVSFRLRGERYNRVTCWSAREALPALGTESSFLDKKGCLKTFLRSQTSESKQHSKGVICQNS